MSGIRTDTTLNMSDSALFACCANPITHGERTPRPKQDFWNEL